MYEYAYTHRVYRVLGFFSCRPNWDPPTPLPAGECVPPFGSVGMDTLDGGRGGGAGRGSHFGRGDRHCGTLGIQYVVFTVQSSNLGPESLVFTISACHLDEN